MIMVELWGCSGRPSTLFTQMWLQRIHGTQLVQLLPKPKRKFCRPDNTGEQPKQDLCHGSTNHWNRSCLFYVSIQELSFQQWLHHQSRHGYRQSPQLFCWSQRCPCHLWRLAASSGTLPSIICSVIHSHGQ